MIYPDIINTIVQLRRPVLNGLIIQQCSDDSHTTCTVDITRDVYRLTVIQINDIGLTSTMYQDVIDSKTCCMIYNLTSLIITFLHSKNIDCY